MPLDATPEQLEALVNAVLAPASGKAGAADAGEPRPYALYLNGAEVVGSLRAALAAQGLSSEASHTLHYQPLALFRVAPVSRCADSLPGHGAPILHISFSPCGGTLASGGGDGAVRFWDARTGTPRFAAAGAHAAHVLCTAWAPDGARFASADKAGVIKVWEPRTGKEACAPLAGHRGWVAALAWEPLHAVGARAGGAGASAPRWSKPPVRQRWSVLSASALTRWPWPASVRTSLAPAPSGASA